MILYQTMDYSWIYQYLICIDENNKRIQDSLLGYLIELHALTTKWEQKYFILFVEISSDIYQPISNIQSWHEEKCDDLLKLLTAELKLLRVFVIAPRMVRNHQEIIIEWGWNLHCYATPHPVDSHNRFLHHQAQVIWVMHRLMLLKTITTRAIANLSPANETHHFSIICVTETAFRCTKTLNKRGIRWWCFELER